MLPDPERDESGVPLPLGIDERPDDRETRKPDRPRVIVLDYGDDEPTPSRGSVIEIDLVNP
jgi:hypothetical protein